MTRESLRELRRLGRRQGYLTLAEIRERLSEDKDEATIQEVAERLEEAGFRILEEDEAARPAETPQEADDIVSLYMHGVSQVPLLTAEEEVELAQAIEAGEEAKRRLEAKRNLAARTRAKLRATVRQGGDARDHFTKANTRLVISIAKKYLNQGVPFLDLIQEGNLGLMKAIERFDWRRGFKFSTYATWWIRQSIARAVANQGRTIRLPAHIGDRLRQLNKATQELIQVLNREPTAEELAALMETDAEEVEWLQQVSHRPISLEKPLFEEESDEDTLGQMVANEDEPPPSEVAAGDFLRQDVDTILRSLTPREARILELRFGLRGRREHTLREVGDKFGLTRERIRQIEKEALARLRAPTRSERLKDYLAEE